LKAGLSKNSDAAVFCSTITEARIAAENGKIAARSLVEGRSSFFVRRRIKKSACWRWCHMIISAGTATTFFAAPPWTAAGELTEAGRAFLRAAQDMGVVIDLSTPLKILLGCDGDYIRVRSLPATRIQPRCILRFPEI
jgi:hypothetical protein